MRNAMKIAAFGLAAGAAVMVATSAPVLARGAGGTGPWDSQGLVGPDGGVFAIQFTDLDTDGDGKITEAELSARADALLAERLAEVDTDGDGAVSAAEIAAQALARIEARVDGRDTGRRMADPAEVAKTIAERMIAARDTDGDGVLSGEELMPGTGIATLVDRFDTDDDNAISQAEYDTAKQDMQDRFANRDNRGGWGDRGKGGPGPRGGNPGGRW